MKELTKKRKYVKKCEVDGRIESCRRTIARMKAEGRTLGRPKGARNKQTKLSGIPVEQIKELLMKQTVRATAKSLRVSEATLYKFISENGLSQYSNYGKEQMAFSILNSNKAFLLKNPDMSYAKIADMYHISPYYIAKWKRESGINGTD